MLERAGRGWGENAVGGWQGLGVAGRVAGEGWRGSWRGKVGSKPCVLSVKVATTFISRSVWKVEWHFDRFFTVT